LKFDNKGENLMRQLFFVCLISVFAFGCTSVPLKIKSNVVNEYNKTYEVLGEGEGSSMGVMLFHVIRINQNDRFVNAYKDAIDSKGGDALIDPEISERWFWAYAFNGYITTIQGTVIKYKDKPQEK